MINYRVSHLTLTNTNLYDVNFTNADLTDANLSGAKFSNNEFDGALLDCVKGFVLEHNERLGALLIKVDSETNELTLNMTIEQSDNLTDWTKVDEAITRTVTIPEGKKFYSMCAH